MQLILHVVTARCIAALNVPNLVANQIIWIHAVKRVGNQENVIRPVNSIKAGEPRL